MYFLFHSPACLFAYSQSFKSCGGNLHFAASCSEASRGACPNNFGNVLIGAKNYSVVLCISSGRGSICHTPISLSSESMNTNTNMGTFFRCWLLSTVMGRRSKQTRREVRGMTWTLTKEWGEDGCWHSRKELWETRREQCVSGTRHPLTARRIILHTHVHTNLACSCLRRRWGAPEWKH